MKFFQRFFYHDCRPIKWFTCLVLAQWMNPLPYPAYRFSTWIVTSLVSLHPNYFWLSKPLASSPIGPKETLGLNLPHEHSHLATLTNLEPKKNSWTGLNWKLGNFELSIIGCRASATATSKGPLRYPVLEDSFKTRRLLRRGGIFTTLHIHTHMYIQRDRNQAKIGENKACIFYLGTN